MASTMALATKKSWFSGLKYSYRTFSKNSLSRMGQFLGIWSSCPVRQAVTAQDAQVNMGALSLPGPLPGRCFPHHSTLLPPLPPRPEKKRGRLRAPGLRSPFSLQIYLRFYSPLYFFLVAIPPRICRWALFSSRTRFTWR